MRRLPLEKRKVRRAISVCQSLECYAIRSSYELALPLTVFGKKTNHSTDRKPIDPPPIIELQIINNRDPGRSFLQSTFLGGTNIFSGGITIWREVKLTLWIPGPYFFMSVNLLKGGDSQQGSGSTTNVNTSLAGTLVSSLHRLKDVDTQNQDGGFFVFADLSVKIEGIYVSRNQAPNIIKSVILTLNTILKIIIAPETLKDQSVHPSWPF